MNKLDYRCQGQGCAEARTCRRWLTGDAAKNCTVPYAAFDMRDTVVCDGWLERLPTGPCVIKGCAAAAQTVTN